MLTWNSYIIDKTKQNLFILSVKATSNVKVTCFHDAAFLVSLEKN